MPDGPRVPLASRQGHWLLAATVLGSGLAGIDATVVSIALPAIGRSFDASFAALQWVVTGYALTLAAFILVGGALGDRFGRRRVFGLGVLWFAAASVLCGVAPTAELLIAGRALQGRVTDRPVVGPAPEGASATTGSGSAERSSVMASPFSLSGASTQCRGARRG